MAHAEQTSHSSKSRKMFLLFSHTLTDGQKKDARESLGVAEFIALPEALQRYWSQIPPESDLDESDLGRLLDWLSAEADRGDYVLVQGDFGATFYVVDFCLLNGLRPVYATTRRTVTQETSAENKVISVKHFEHVRYRHFRYFQEHKRDSK